MAYRIDFTASNYILRSRRKLFLRLLLLATIGGLAWGGHFVYTEYHESTLDMKLAEYEVEAYPIEEINFEWDAASKEYAKLTQYYRLVWAANPTNFLGSMAATDTPIHNKGLQPKCWLLRTGGECRLDYKFAFSTGDKAEQTKNLGSELVHAVTSVVRVVDGKVDVQGVKHEKLLNVNELDIAIRFSLPNIKLFPVKNSEIAKCVNRIAAMRKSIHDIKISNNKGVAGQTSKVGEMMRAYLQTGRDKSGFPCVTNVIDVSGWMKKADDFILRNRIPDNPSRLKFKEDWNRIGKARWPWKRFRKIDNQGIVQSTIELREIATRVKRYKQFLSQRREDYKKNLEPFIDAYTHNDIFNRPLIESDLINRVAKTCGIANAMCTFKDEIVEVPAVLIKENEEFTFTWVRWTLFIGNEIKSNDKQKQNATEDLEKGLALEKISECVNKILKLGPGYALDSIKINFGDDGSVAGAVLEGLLPVKQVEALKEAKKNVN